MLFAEAKSYILEGYKKDILGVLHTGFEPAKDYFLFCSSFVFIIVYVQ